MVGKKKLINYLRPSRIKIPKSNFDENRLQVHEKSLLQTERRPGYFTCERERERERKGVCVCLCTYVRADTVCQERTFNQKQTHSIAAAVGFGIRFGLVILENTGIDHKIMGVA